MTMELAKVDLTNCDQEPIHLSAAIQPCGFLLALSAPHLRVVGVSANISAAFGEQPVDLLGRSIEELFSAEGTQHIRALASGSNVEHPTPVAMTLAARASERQFDAILHRSGDAIIIELELADAPHLLPPHEFHRIVRGSVAAFNAVRTVQQLCDAAVAEISELSGFDRVMVYRFDEAWNGEVVAERHAAGMEPYLGLHYPASDIPRQAREIFKQNWLRFIADVAYVPVPLIVDPAAGAEALDLSRSILRSVSRLHIEYLENMGVAASMTVSLLKDGELWGLIACHHRSPRLLGYQLRFVCEMVGRSMSLNLSTIEESEDKAYRMQLKTGQMQLLKAMTDTRDIWAALAGGENELLAIAGSDGAAILFGEDCRLIGSTPVLKDVLMITDWLAENVADEVYVSDSLPLAEPRFTALKESACGIVAVALSSAKRSYILWFRGEHILTVDWGGEPTKVLRNGHNGVALTPRASFAAWKEQVRLHSRRWTTPEVEAARESGRLISTLIVDRAADLERVNRELESLLRSNVELDSFAHIASHDLKEPLRGIHNYASFLMEDYGSVVGEDGREKLETLVRLSRRMEMLIESLLVLSSVGRGELVSSPIDLRDVIADVAEMFEPRLAQCHGSISVVTALPLVYVDGPRLNQVFSNLISNAIKYSDRPPRIEIGAEPGHKPPSHVAPDSDAAPVGSEFTTVFVRDNGVGIPKKHLDAIFQMFKRLHANDSYGGGTGAGLAIARKIIMRHGGQMWAESEVGSGTTIFFTLPEKIV